MRFIFFARVTKSRSSRNEKTVGCYFLIVFFTSNKLSGRMACKQTTAVWRPKFSFLCTISQSKACLYQKSGSDRCSSLKYNGKFYVSHFSRLQSGAVQTSSFPSGTRLTWIFKLTMFSRSRLFEIDLQISSFDEIVPAGSRRSFIPNVCGIHFQPKRSSLKGAIPLLEYDYASGVEDLYFAY